MLRSPASLTAGVLTVCAVLLASHIAQAQPAAQGAFRYKADKISLTPQGVRLDGNAQVVAESPDKNQPPQLDVRAAAIAFDFEKNQITEVRARGNVNMKVNLVPKGGGVATRIEATGDEADLNPPTRTLVLRGNVDGFYQVGNGVRTTLAGTKVTAKYINGQPDVEIIGPVTVIVPPEAPTGPNGASAIGTVTVTSRNARFDQKSGEVHFVGEAHAVSTDGPNKFDVAAPEMVLTRGDGNTIDTLRTVGRTRLKIDLPPDPPKPTTSTPATPATPVAPATPATPAAGETKIGKPTHVEVEADAATVNRKTNTMTFEGNVIGFYNLAPAGEQAQRYDFTGNKAIIKYIPDAQASTENPAGLKADITGTKGKPVEVETPAFNLDLSG